MGKHVLSNVEGFIDRAGGEIYNVDPRCIKVVSGWNKRLDFSGEENLKAYMIYNKPPPLFVRKTKNNILELVDGERRLRAALSLIKEGIGIREIPVIVAPKNMNQVDLMFRSVAFNNGKDLLPIEEAGFFKQLKEWGVSRQKIADNCGVSLSTVRNRLELYNAVPAVKEAVSNKEISIKAAQVIINDSDGEVSKQTENLKVAKATPKVRHKTIDIKPKDFCKFKSCHGSMGSSNCKISSASCLFSVRDFIKWLNEKDIKMTMCVKLEKSQKRNINK